MKTSYSAALRSLALVAIVLVGCQDKVVVEETVLLEGTVTKGGQPLAVDTAKLGDYAKVEVRFIPLDKSSAGYAVRVQPDGKFIVATETGQPLPPGKYRVAVRQWEPYPSNDLLKGKFDEARSPIEVQLGPDTKSVTIDLDKPKG